MAGAKEEVGIQQQLSHGLAPGVSADIMHCLDTQAKPQYGPALLSHDYSPFALHYPIMFPVCLRARRNGESRIHGIANPRPYNTSLFVSRHATHANNSQY